MFANKYITIDFQFAANFYIFICVIFLLEKQVKQNEKVFISFEFDYHPHFLVFVFAN